MRVLVTGGAGFIGSHLVEHFHRQADVRVVDNLSSGHLHTISAFGVEFIEGSILDRDLLRRAMQGVDLVFHLAAMVSVPESMRDPVGCIEVNTKGTLIVLEEAARAGVKKVCFSSSSAVYGDGPGLPGDEGMAPAPLSPYAVTKLSGEQFCAITQAATGMEAVALRYFNVFGPRQDPASAYAAVIPAFVSHAVAGTDLTVYGDGEQTRDFVYVKDVVAANVFCATTPGVSGVFNVGYGSAVTINKLAQIVLELTASRSHIKHLESRPGDVRHSLAAVSKLFAAGFRPVASFGEGLAETVSFFAGNGHC